MSSKSQEELAQEHAADEQAAKQAASEGVLYGVTLNHFTDHSREQLAEMYQPHHLARIERTLGLAGLQIGQNYKKPEVKKEPESEAAPAPGEPSPEE